MKHFKAFHCIEKCSIFCHRPSPDWCLRTDMLNFKMGMFVCAA